MNRTAPTSGALRLASYTPDTGTTELPRAHRGRPYWEADTVVLHLADLRTPPPARRLRDRVRVSEAAAHLRAATASTYWPGWIGAGLLAGVVLINWLAAGQYWSPDGFTPIPTDGLPR